MEIISNIADDQPESSPSEDSPDTCSDVRLLFAMGSYRLLIVFPGNSPCSEEPLTVYGIFECVRTSCFYFFDALLLNEAKFRVAIIVLRMLNLFYVVLQRRPRTFFLVATLSESREEPEDKTLDSFYSLGVFVVLVTGSTRSFATIILRQK